MKNDQNIGSQTRAARPPAESPVVDGQSPVRWPAVSVGGMSIHALSEAQCVGHILDEIDQGRGGWVITPNLDHARRFRRDREFADLCEGATLVTADGMPLVWASRLRGTPLPERVAGSNLVRSLSLAAADRGRSIFLLGGDEGTAEEAARTLSRERPDLRIAGTHCPPFGFEHDRAQSEAIVRSLTDAAPDIIYVAIGSPKQERLIAQLRDLLPRAWWLGVGISFSFLAERVKRAPLWMQRCGLEWTHRLAQEPRRLARRYLVDGLPFAMELMVASAWQGVRHRWHGRTGLRPDPGAG